MTSCWWTMVGFITISPEVSLLIVISDDEQDSLNEDNTGERLYQNFRTLLSWHTAATYIASQATHVKQVKATLITLADHYRDPFTHVDALKDAIRAALVARFGEDPNRAAKATEIFNEKAKTLKEFHGHIHAEAALIALANYSRDSQVKMDTSLRDMFASEVC